MTTIGTRSCLGLVLVYSLVALLWAAPGKAAEYYTEPQIYGSRPPVDRETRLGNIGPTGIEARIGRGVIVTVEGTQPGTPATGKFGKGDVIEGVNGVALKGKNPFVVLGNAITEAEATDGKLSFAVLREGGRSKVTIGIPVLGAYSKTWPRNCAKSRKVIEQAAAYYASDEAFRDKSGVPGGLACLFLLSTGNDDYLPRVKRYFAPFIGNPRGIGDHTWNNGYNGIAVCEYYLRTGDPDVLPVIQFYCDNARERQKYDTAWSHWGQGIAPGYCGAGIMNPASVQILTTLVLAKECGAKVDEKTLLNALTFFYRFVGRGTVPYGDNRAEGGLSSNGKDGMLAAAMQAACGADGDTSIYQNARDMLSMATITSYPGLVRGHGDEGRGDGMWRGLAASFLMEKQAREYQAMMDRLTWWYDLSRHANGGFGIATCKRFNDLGSGAGVVLSYTAPLKTLRMPGAPRTVHAKHITLPEHVWGNDADLAFHDIEHNPKHLTDGGDEPIHVPFYRFGNAYMKRSAGDLQGVTEEEMVRYAYHKRFVVRAQAAKALRVTGRLDALTKLLGDPDPRVRRGALDGIIDYRYFFTYGNQPLGPETYTQALTDAIVEILKNPDEAWFVIDGALLAIRNAPAKAIHENLDRIMPWTTHEDWWLRESSFHALTGLDKDDALFAEILPTLIKMMQVEYNEFPRSVMHRYLGQAMRRLKPGSPAGQTITAGLLAAAKESTILPGTRAPEGAHNVCGALLTALESNPASAVEVARALRGRRSDIDDGYLRKIICEPPKGLVQLLDEQTDADRKALTDILYDDFVPELRRRLKVAPEQEKPHLVNALLTTIKLKKEVAGWQPIGAPVHPERVWRYYAFNPLTEADQLDPRKEQVKRLRTITMPEGMENWYAPGFDVSEWKRGRAPIGVGEFFGGGYSRPKEWLSEWNKKTRYTTQSQQGDTEFLLMRTTFNLKRLDYDQYRLRVLAKGGYHVYLNGHKIHTYIWFQFWPQYTAIVKDEIGKYLKEGENTLAVFSNSAIQKPRGEEVYKPLAQSDVYIEGLRFKDLE